MNLFENAIKLGTIIVMLAAPSVARAQGAVTITADDMFNTIGQWYRAYANTDDVGVSGRLGTTGGPQVWDFVNGPKDQIYRFDYVSVTDGGNGADFPKAKVAERMTTEGDGTKKWLYFEQVAGIGRQTYGFYDAKFSADQPSNPFKSPIVDFPAAIHYQGTWSTSTSFSTDILTIDTAPDPNIPDDAGGGGFNIPTIINYSSTATADAFGIINMPGIGFGEGLRVNELVTYDIQVDLGFGDGFQTVATEYIRNYYWLMEDHGIAVQITSKQETQPPSENFTTAASFVRMFETNHTTGDRPPDGVTGLKVTFGKDRVLLNWDRFGSAKTYRVEYTGNLSDRNSWKVLGTPVPDNFMFDITITSDQARFYRVVGLP